MLNASQVVELNILFSVELTMGDSSKRSTGKWECILPEMLIADYSVIPLTSAKILKSESYWMQNCCREYTYMCADLRYCIFSIRNRFGERLATLGLAKEGAYWNFQQCFGPQNTQILESIREYTEEKGLIHAEWSSTDLYDIAHEIVRMMNSEQKQYCSTKNFSSKTTSVERE